MENINISNKASWEIAAKWKMKQNHDGRRDRQTDRQTFIQAAIHKNSCIHMCCVKGCSYLLHYVFCCHIMHSLSSSWTTTTPMYYLM